MAWEDALSAYEKFEFEDGPWTRPVWRRGQGPAVIVIHEIPGLHPLVIRFADRVAEAGMTVFLPSLIGDPGRPVSGGYALKSMATAFCVRREGSTLEAEALREWVNAQVGKTQRLSAVHWLPELPRSAIGKVLKRELREAWRG